MKKTVIMALMLSMALYSCKDKNAAEGTETAEQTEAAPAEKTPIYVVNEADWVETDLSGTSTLTPIIVKLPKDAVLEKNGNGGVDVTLAEDYVISVYAQAVSSMEELIKGNKGLTVGRTEQYVDIKTIVDEPNGFVFTYTMKPEANGATYNPESHFFYALETEGKAFFSLSDSGSMTMSEKVYTEEAAKKVYEIIKSSAKVKE
ncbi:hypothetical protein OGH69_04245 [Flavobacterium sp. MFBS3-15]|uniref:hypothetical protein n=1 Tax=Flavobacterium sp. MFBS3-15 TaxID=2989816 RepID=UPI002236A8F3|nr:hypothetical protein [Flavobacterium sp. MFBS3-15]MCW4468167.1 hypothetical protein [Flavobacterium sp. MFBS3-15]